MKMRAVTLVLVLSAFLTAEAQAYFVYVQAGGPRRVASQTEPPAQENEDGSKQDSPGDLEALDDPEDSPVEEE